MVVPATVACSCVNIARGSADGPPGARSAPSAAGTRSRRLGAPPRTSPRRAVERAAAGDDVEGRGDLRVLGGVAVRDAADEQAERSVGPRGARRASCCLRTSGSAAGRRPGSGGSGPSRTANPTRTIRRSGRSRRASRIAPPARRRARSSEAEGRDAPGRAWRQRYLWVCPRDRPVELGDGAPSLRPAHLAGAARARRAGGDACPERGRRRLGHLVPRPDPPVPEAATSRARMRRRRMTASSRSPACSSPSSR